MDPDPDDFSVSVLTGLATLLGVSILAFAGYWFLSFFGKFIIP
jgi:hypothetical protein